MKAVATFLFAFLLSINTARAEDVTLPVVVELYTAQGCVSCPPADAMLRQAVSHPSIIGLSCHVTYWDYLGWKDTQAHEFCNQRQFAYMPRFNLRNYYTPQMIVNGRQELVGHNKEKLRDAITATGQSPVLSLPLERKGKNILLQLPATGVQGDYTLWVFGYKTVHSENVQAGENKGKTTQSANTVVTLENAGTWQGEAGTRTLQMPRNADIDGIAVLAQQDAYGPVVAAGRLTWGRTE
jgi:hypothetical protein